MGRKDVPEEGQDESKLSDAARKRLKRAHTYMQYAKRKDREAEGVEEWASKRYDEDEGQWDKATKRIIARKIRSGKSHRVKRLLPRIMKRRYY